MFVSNALALRYDIGWVFLSWTMFYALLVWYSLAVRLKHCLLFF